MSRPANKRRDWWAVAPSALRSTRCSRRLGRAAARFWWCVASPGLGSPFCWTTWRSARRGAGSRGRVRSSRRWNCPWPGCSSSWARRCSERVENLPAPQRDALRLAFGLSEGPAPDRFLLGLAALSLLSDVAEERPLVCVVDDVQWLDRESAQVLSFVARRLEAEPIGMVFAVREPSEVQELAGLPELVVEGLEEHDARVLLASGFPGGLDEQVRDRIVAETRGNPLALLELPRGLTATELAGGFGFSPAHPLPGRIEESFLRRLETLPEDTRLLLLVAAAEPGGGSAADVARGRATRRRAFRRPPWRRRMTADDRRARDVPPSVGAVGDLRMRRRHRTAGRCTWRWQRRPTGKRTRIAGRGISRRRRTGPMRRSRWSSSARQAARRRAAGSLPRRHSCSAPWR